MAAPAPARVPQNQPARNLRLAIFLGVAGVAAAGAAYYGFNGRRTTERHLTGYVNDIASLRSEYLRFQGKALKNAEVEQQFADANAATEKGEYGRAVDLLRSASRQAPLPVVFNDLGVLYVQLNDRARAINAFRDALSRDAGYDPVRRNLDRFRAFTSNLTDPVTAEVEPNNGIDYANLVAVGSSVDAEVKDLTDEDYFRFTSPPAPRDRLEILIANRSATLAPRFRMFDEGGSILPDAKETRTAGESLDWIFSPPPNTTFHLAVSGAKSTTGAYTLTIKALKGFDRYEPNDDIFSARKIAVGERIDANIMDSEDTDYFSFVGPRNGTVSIDIENRSEFLVPALTTFTPDLRTSGFGPDVKRPGGSMHHSIAVEEGQTYYLQVWSQARTTGEYSLKVH